MDKRAELWAFGVVLYEMLTGQRAFQGDEVLETLAKVIEREPDFAALPTGTPLPRRYRDPPGSNWTAGLALPRLSQ